MSESDFTRLAALLTKSEGWPVVKRFIDLFAVSVENEIASSKTEEDMKQAAYKLKYGALALSQMKALFEQQAEILDKKKES